MKNLTIGLFTILMLTLSSCHKNEVKDLDCYNKFSQEVTNLNNQYSGGNMSDREFQSRMIAIQERYEDCKK